MGHGQGGEGLWWWSVGALRALALYHTLTILYQGVVRTAAQNMQM